MFVYKPTVQIKITRQDNAITSYPVRGKTVIVTLNQIYTVWDS